MMESGHGDEGFRALARRVGAIHAQRVTICVIVHGDGDVELILQILLEGDDSPGGDVLGVIDDAVLHVDDRGNADADLLHGRGNDGAYFGGQVFQGFLQGSIRGERGDGETLRDLAVFDQAEAQVGSSDVYSERHTYCSFEIKLWVFGYYKILKTPLGRSFFLQN